MNGHCRISHLLKLLSSGYAEPVKHPSISGENSTPEQASGSECASAIASVTTRQSTTAVPPEVKRVYLPRQLLKRVFNQNNLTIGVSIKPRPLS
jgi:hypothetical protein